MREFCCLCFIGLCFMTGCTNQQSDAPPRYALSGQVTFDGKLVPVGTISFSPDSAKGNNGPGTSTAIKDGRYRTNPKKGVIGGRMIVEMTGSDGVAVIRDGETVESGSPLFKPYRLEIDIPRQNAQQNFDIPKSAASD